MSVSPTRDRPRAERVRGLRGSPPSCLVVGYDGSAGSRAAVRWAAAALPQDGELVLVHACRPLHAPAMPLRTTDDRRRYAHALIDELVLEGEDPLLEHRLQAEVRDEDPVTALTGAADRTGATAIVVGAGRHSRVQKAIGTVTSDLLVAASVPVIAVPHPAT